MGNLNLNLKCQVVFGEGHLVVKFGGIGPYYFEWIFGPLGQEYEQANFQKFKYPVGCVEVSN